MVLRFWYRREKNERNLVLQLYLEKVRLKIDSGVLFFTVNKGTL